LVKYIPYQLNDFDQGNIKPQMLDAYDVFNILSNMVRWNSDNTVTMSY